MKTLLALAIALFAFVGVTTAEAGHPAPRISHHLPCGKAVYAYPTVVGYYACGTPAYRWVTRNATCGCNTCNPQVHRGHSSHGSYRSYRPSNSCGTRTYRPPARSSCGNSGFSFRIGF